MKNSCKNCRFWRQDYLRGGEPEEYGECRRHAPITLAQWDKGEDFPEPPQGYWPITSEHRDCGEWQKIGGNFVRPEITEAERRELHRHQTQNHSDILAEHFQSATNFGLL